VAEGKSLHEIERDMFNQLLSMGRHAVAAVLQLHRTDDLGASYVMSEGRQLRRSAIPKPRRLRTNSSHIVDATEIENNHVHRKALASYQPILATKEHLRIFGYTLEKKDQTDERRRHPHNVP
jgi:hypothetical protein